MTRQVEYRGDVVSLTEALVGFPSGGQVLMSGSTYQRVYGNLHSVQFDDHLLAKLTRPTLPKRPQGMYWKCRAEYAETDCEVLCGKIIAKAS